MSPSDGAACGDDGWAAALHDLHRALVPGGRLVFDSRDPRARAWDRWNLADSRSRVELQDRTEVEVVTEVTAVDDNVVSFATLYRFDDGTSLTSTADLRFRTIDELLARRGGLLDQNRVRRVGAPARRGARR